MAGAILAQLGVRLTYATLFGETGIWEGSLAQMGSQVAERIVLALLLIAGLAITARVSVPRIALPKASLPSSAGASDGGGIHPEQSLKHTRVVTDRAVLLSRPLDVFNRRLWGLGIQLVLTWVIAPYLIVNNFLPILTTFFAVMFTLGLFYRTSNVAAKRRIATGASELTITLRDQGVALPAELHPRQTSLIPYSHIKRCQLERVKGSAEDNSELVIRHASADEFIDVRIGSSWFANDETLIREIIDLINSRLS